MAMKPEEVLRVIQAARGNAICIPTMTTGPAWRDIAPDDLSAGCVGFMGGASSLGLGLALARPERRVIVFDGDGSLGIGELDDFKRRLSQLLTAEGPIFVELHTTLADQTPMTAGGGSPFHQQMERLRTKLLTAKT